MFLSDSLRGAVTVEPDAVPAGNAVPVFLRCGTLFRFRAPGDEVAAHTHRPPVSSHLTIVLAGSVEYIAGAERRVLLAGDVLEVPPNVEHRLVGVLPGSACLNLPLALLDV